jgi:hypothetical protein
MESSTLALLALLAFPARIRNVFARYVDGGSLHQTEEEE